MSAFLADPPSFTGFYRANARDVLIFFTRRTFDAAAALDLTAETFAQAFASRRTFRSATDEEARGWLFTIARRQLERTEELAGLSDLRGVLREQLSALDAGQRDALWLRVVDEQPYAQVAQRLGITEQAARTRVSRALRTRRRCAHRAGGRPDRGHRP